MNSVGTGHGSLVPKGWYYHHWTGYVVQEIQRLLCKCKAPSSNPSLTHTKKSKSMTGQPGNAHSIGKGEQALPANAFIYHWSGVASLSFDSGTLQKLLSEEKSAYDFLVWGPFCLWSLYLHRQLSVRKAGQNHPPAPWCLHLVQIFMQFSSTVREVTYPVLPWCL